MKNEKGWENDRNNWIWTAPKRNVSNPNYFEFILESEVKRIKWIYKLWIWKKKPNQFHLLNW